MRIISILLVFGLFSTAHGKSVIWPDLSELSPFEAEWCAPNSSSPENPTRIKEACFGHVRFRNQRSVRALEFKTSGGQKFVYIDADFRGVELSRLEITLLGPVFVTPENSDKVPDSIQQMGMELGHASFQIDQNGEVVAFKSFTILMNVVIAFR